MVVDKKKKKMENMQDITEMMHKGGNRPIFDMTTGFMETINTTIGDICQSRRDRDSVAVMNGLDTLFALIEFELIKKWKPEELKALKQMIANARSGDEIDKLKLFSKLIRAVDSCGMLIRRSKGGLGVMS